MSGLRHNYCYICNDATDNKWVCTKCVDRHSIREWRTKWDLLPARHTPRTPVPEWITEKYGGIYLPAVDPDLLVDVGL